VIYSFVLLDRPHASELRARVRPERKAYLGLQAERIAFAAPFVDDEGKDMQGSLLTIDLPRREDAVAWFRDEPFNKAGLYASVQIHGFVNLWPQETGFAPQ